MGSVLFQISGIHWGVCGKGRDYCISHSVLDPSLPGNQKEALGRWGGICNQLQFEIQPFSIYWWCRIPHYASRNSVNWSEIEHYSLFQGNMNKVCPKKNWTTYTCLWFPLTLPQHTQKSVCRVQSSPYQNSMKWISIIQLAKQFWKEL